MSSYDSIPPDAFDKMSADQFTLKPSRKQRRKESRKACIMRSRQERKRKRALRDFLASETKQGMKEKYRAYLKSPKWEFFRKAIIRERGEMCERCGKNRPPLNVHHLTYVRLGNELPEDVKVYCLPCHKLMHPGWE